MSRFKRDYRIVGKVILKAKLKNITPLLIGSGMGESVDISVIRFPTDGRPYIPASSFSGALKRFLTQNNAQSGIPVAYIWGDNGTNSTYQSHLRIDDLIPQEFTPSDLNVRDGVKIDAVNGVVENGKKYDYEIVEPGLVFPFSAELTIRQAIKVTESDIKQFVHLIKQALCNPNFRVGAFTNTGFGKIECIDFIAYFFDFSQNKENVDAWFEFIEKDSISIPELDLSELESKGDQDSLEAGLFKVDALFEIKSSLLVGAYSDDPDSADKTQIKSRDRFVLPGKSIRGAIRHRALRILKMWDSEHADEKLISLFGFVDEGKHVQQRGRLRVEEHILDANSVILQTQDRIRIDRFTGSVIEGALFNSEPIWSKGNPCIRIELTVTQGATPEDKMLLMQILKDLWTEDLAVGGEKNIGRGVLRGHDAKIYNDGELLAHLVRKDSNGITFIKGSASVLNNLVLNEYNRA